MQKKLAAYLPGVLLTTYEFPMICRAEQPEVDALHTAADEVLDASFVSLAGERGIARFERVFGLTPQDTDTLDERRFRVLTKINAQLPFSIRRLKQQLATLCGAAGYRLTLSPAEYSLEVKVALTAKRNLNAVQKLLQDIVPANIVRKCGLLYNQHQTVARLTHAQLSKYTHQQIREEVLPNA